MHHVLSNSTYCRLNYYLQYISRILHILWNVSKLQVGRIQGKQKRNGNRKREREKPAKMLDTGYNVNIEIIFYSMMLFGNDVGPLFH